jgi:hypothetical protein
MGKKQLTEAQEIATKVLKDLGVKPEMFNLVEKEKEEVTISQEEYRLQTLAETALRDLEVSRGSLITDISVYYGDIVVDGDECSGTKLLISFKGEEEEDTEEELCIDEFGCLIQNPTVQDILEAYYITKHNIEALILNSVGIDHITDKYLEALESEKEECRKALGQDNIEYFKLL